MKALHVVWAGLLALAAISVVRAQGAAPSDAQIAQIVVTANQVDIDAGQLAASKASSKDVKDFAQLMITDHSGVNKSAVALVTRLHVTPQPSTTSDSLKQGGEQNVAALKQLSGSAFDRAYVAHEVAYHQAVIDALDNTLVPNAQNAELKALLIKVRPAFVAHLAHAKELQAALAK
jgi:putative membrane protein